MRNSRAYGLASGFDCRDPAQRALRRRRFAFGRSAQISPQGAGFRISLVKTALLDSADFSDTLARSGRIAIFFLAGMVRFLGMSSRALRC